MPGPTPAKAAVPSAARPAPTPQVPSVSRNVHYTTNTGAVRAALIGDVDVEDEGIVSLIVFNRLGAHWVEDVEYSETSKPGCWSWPPRV